MSDDEDDDDDEKVTQEFFARADEVIAVANRQTKEARSGIVSSSLLYAAARFNAFHVARMAESAEEMRQDREAAIEYFTGQYRSMLEQNLEDYLENFASYMEREKESAG